MLLNEAITARFKKVQYVRTWQKLLWSNGLASAIKYTLFRSRGYAMRQATYRGLELIEVVAISLIASKSIFMIAAGLVLVTIFESLIIRGVLESLRCFLLSGKKIQPKHALMAGVSITLVTYLAYAAWYAEDILLYRELVLFFVLKLIASTSSVLVQSLTATVYAFKRVYFPPMLNLVTVGLALLVAVLANSVQTGGFYIVAFGFVAIRLTMDFIGLMLARKAESSLSKPVDFPQIKDKKDWSVLFKRVLMMSSQFAVPGVAAMVSPQAKVIVGVWGLQTFLLAMCSRPFRSIFVDIYHMIHSQFWMFLKYRLSLSLKVATMLFALMVCALIAASAISEIFTLAAATWVILAVANGMYGNYLQSIAQDTKVFKYFVSIRLLAVVGIIALSMFEQNPLIAACLGELLLSILLVGHCKRFDTIKALKFDLFYENNPEAKIIPRSFFKRFYMGRAFLRDHGFKEQCIMVHLRSSYGSDKAMDGFIAKVKEQLRSYDQVIAINKGKLLVWAPFARDITVISQRLIQAFPIDILKIESQGEPSSQDSKARINLLRNAPALTRLGAIISADKASTLSSLGTWWVLDDLGLWQSKEDVAGPDLTLDLYKIYAKSEKTVFLDKVLKHKSEEHTLYALRSFGFLEAVFQAKKDVVVGSAFFDFKEAYKQVHQHISQIEDEVTVESWAYLNNLISNVVEAQKIEGTVAIERRKLKKSEQVVATTSDGQELVDLVLSIDKKQAA